MKNSLLTGVVLLLCSTTLFAQNIGRISGLITDSNTRKPLDYASIKIYNANNQIASQLLSDDSGLFITTNLPTGVYSLAVCCVGYQTTRVEHIIVEPGKTTNVNVALRPAATKQLKCVVFSKTRTLVNFRGARADGVAFTNSGVDGGIKYAHTPENGFTTVRQSPLSTFSIDVDRASYTHIRHYLNNNQLPPTDAVRIEEMMNYFTYSTPANNAFANHPFTLHSEVAQAPWNTNRRLLHIQLNTKTFVAEAATPANLTFLIDVSGSMSDANKLPLLIQSLQLLVNALREQDRVSIVVYAGAAGLVLPPTSGNNKQAIMDALTKLQAGGSTAGGEGIKLAYRMAEENKLPHGNNRIILATDGDFNVGVSDIEGLTQLITEKRKSGIYLSVLGFGDEGVNDANMELLADKGNGNYNYIDGLREGHKVLVKELGATLYTVAKDVKIQLEFNPALVSAYKLIGYENRLLNAADFNNDTIDAGELGSGHSVTAIYEIVTTADTFNTGIDTLKYQPPTTIPGNELCTIKVRYKQPDKSNSIRFEQAVNDNNRELEKAPEDMRFATAVALFGLKLKNSPDVAHINYKNIQQLATNAKGKDREGYRAELLHLIEAAALISGSNN